jgi:hypothetical protein
MRPIFREAAIRHYASSRRASDTPAIPRAPVVSSLMLLGLLLMLELSVLIWARIPDYGRGAAALSPPSLDGRRTVVVAVPASLRSELRPGQAVIVRSARGEVLHARIAAIGVDRTRGPTAALAAKLQDAGLASRNSALALAVVRPARDQGGIAATAGIHSADVEIRRRRILPYILDSLG